MMDTAWHASGPYHWPNVRMRDSVELVEVQLVLGSDIDIGTLVLRHVAVLGRRKDWCGVSISNYAVRQGCNLTSDALSVMLFLVPVHADFMAANDGFQAVPLAETFGDIRAELHADATLARAAAWFGLRVCPQHLHHQAGLARLPLLVPVQLADVFQSHVVVGEQASVEDKVLLADQSCQGKCREAFREELEDTEGRVSVTPICRAFLDSPLVVLGLAFSLKTVDLVHIIRFMISTIQEEVVWSQPLVGVQQ